MLLLIALGRLNSEPFYLPGKCTCRYYTYINRTTGLRLVLPAQRKKNRKHLKTLGWVETRSRQKLRLRNQLQPHCRQLFIRRNDQWEALNELKTILQMLNTSVPNFFNGSSAMTYVCKQKARNRHTIESKTQRRYH